MLLALTSHMWLSYFRHKVVLVMQNAGLRAAELAVGIKPTELRRQLNLTALKRNKRSRADKTSGCKMLRVNDIDIVPPGDADPAVAASLQHAFVQPASSAPIVSSTSSEPSTSNQVTAPVDTLSDLSTSTLTSVMHVEPLMIHHQENARPTKCSIGSVVKTAPMVSQRVCRT